MALFWWMLSALAAPVAAPTDEAPQPSPIEYPRPSNSRQVDLTGLVKSERVLVRLNRRGGRGLATHLGGAVAVAGGVVLAVATPRPSCDQWCGSVSGWDVAGVGLSLAGASAMIMGSATSLGGPLRATKRLKRHGAPAPSEWTYVGIVGYLATPPLLIAAAATNAFELFVPAAATTYVIALAAPFAQAGINRASFRRATGRRLSRVSVHLTPIYYQGRTGLALAGTW